MSTVSPNGSVFIFCSYSDPVHNAFSLSDLIALRNIIQFLDPWLHFFSTLNVYLNHYVDKALEYEYIESRIPIQVMWKCTLPRQGQMTFECNQYQLKRYVVVILL